MPTTHPLSELGHFLRSWCTELRARRDYRNLLDGEASLAIDADASRNQAHAGREAYTAQQADLEAERLLTAAQDPASPGGPNITPDEARPIRRHIANSARHDGSIVEQFA